MTMSNQIELTCPKCGHSFKGIHYATVNVTLNPELKERVLDCSIHSYSCPNCGYELDYSNEIMIYHDMQQKIFITCFPYEEITRWPEWELDTIYENKRQMAMLGPLMRDINSYRNRIVFGDIYMIEKIRIFELDLDDLAIAIQELSILHDFDFPEVEHIIFKGFPDGMDHVEYLLKINSDWQVMTSPGSFYRETVAKNKENCISAGGNLFIDLRRLIGPFAEDQEFNQNQFRRYRHERKKERKKNK